MDKFKTFFGTVAPLDKNNIDTDAIIPKQYLKSISRSGFGVNLFDEWRYTEYGEPGDDHSKRQKNKDFVLNKKPYDTASILLTGKNFGCGSSREHAVWALKDFGIKTVIAESFADIFYNNCFKNGLLALSLKKSEVSKIFENFNENSAQSIGAFSQADDLKKRIIYTLFILIIYRFGTYIPIPGIDPDKLANIFQQNQGTAFHEGHPQDAYASYLLCLLILGIFY